jgi:hypothetical protein
MAVIKQARRTGHVLHICVAVAFGSFALSSESQGSKY